MAQDLSDPDYVLYEKMRAEMFAGTPYAHDALGTRALVQRHHRRDAAATSMTKWYAPNNAILVIAGDVDPRSTLLEVKRLFGGIPPKKLPARPAVRLGPPHAAAFTMSTDQPNGMAMIAVRTPGLDSRDFAALEVLADVLDSRRFALFGLVPQGKALDADFSLDPLPRAGIAYATVSFAAGQDPKALESDIRAILTAVARHGVPADLVAAAKLQERRAAEFQKNSIAGLRLRLVGCAGALQGQLAGRGAGADREGHRAGRRPRGAPVPRPRPCRHRRDVAARLRQAGALARRLRRPGVDLARRREADGAADLGDGRPCSRLSVPPSTLHPVVTRLPNGLTLIVQTEDVSNTVSVYGHIRNQPDLEEPRGQEGVSDLLDRMFMFGSTRLHRLQFQQALDAIGASEQAGTDFSLQVLPEHFDRGVQLLASNELDPYLPAPSHGGAARPARRERGGPQPESRLPDPALAAPGALPGDRPEPAHGHPGERARAHARCRCTRITARSSGRISRPSS